jgi:hypothetical protein
VYVSERVGADAGGSALVDIVVGVSVLRELYLVMWWCSKVVFVTDVVVRKVGSGGRIFVVQLVSGSCLVPAFPSDASILPDCWKYTKKNWLHCLKRS